MDQRKNQALERIGALVLSVVLDAMIYAARGRAVLHRRLTAKSPRAPV